MKEGTIRRILVLAPLAACSAPAAAQGLLWVQQFGTPSDDRGGGIAVDHLGDIYLTAMTYGSLGGPSAGGQEAYVAKYNASGALLWTRQLGTPTDDAGRRVAVDGAGGVYIAGRTLGSLGGPSAGGRDMFLAKYDTSGELQWVRQIGSFADEHLYPSVAADGAGNVYIANSTMGSVGGPSAGNSDGFIAKYDASGALRWTRQFGTSAWDNAHAIAVDAEQGVYVVGQTEGSLGGPIAGSWDAFLVKFDASGMQVWAQQLGTPVIDGFNDAAVDGMGSVYVLGHTGGSLGGPGAGSRDALLAKFDASGVLQWIQQFGTAEWDSAATIALDGAGGIYITGHTDGSLGGPSAGNNDAFLAKFNTSGTLQWMRQFGTSSLDYASGVAVDGVGGVYMFGETQGSIGGPRLGGVWDAFLAKFEATSCYADCDRSGDLTFFDFLCFQNLFAAMDPAADCDGDSAFTFFDFLCFQNAFAAACP